jgi:hypothetical protein
MLVIFCLYGTRKKNNIVAKNLLKIQDFQFLFFPSTSILIILNFPLLCEFSKKKKLFSDQEKNNNFYDDLYHKIVEGS